MRIIILALRDGLLPPTLNLRDPDPAVRGLDLVGPEARSSRCDYAMSNGFGFGGVNASVVFRRRPSASVPSGRA